MRQVYFDTFFKTQKEAREFCGNPNRIPTQTLKDIPEFGRTNYSFKYVPVAERKPIPLGPCLQALHDNRHKYDGVHKEK